VSRIWRVEKKEESKRYMARLEEGGSKRKGKVKAGTGGGRG
jgi:hypothetical protein